MKDNYFEKKLENTKDSLSWTKQEIIATDNQIVREKLIFEDKINALNIRSKRLETIREKGLKDIKHYEAMISKGYKFIDMKTGKAYKTEKNLRQHQLSKKSPKVNAPDDGVLPADEEAIEKAKEEAKREIELKKIEKARLKAERKEREKLEERRQKAEKERLRLEAIAKKQLAEEKERERKEAEEAAKIEEAKRQKDIALAQERERIAREQSKMYTVEQIRIESAIDLGPFDPKVQIQGPLDKDSTENIAEKREIANDLRAVANDMNGETDEIEWLVRNHQDWQDQFEIEQGGKAIWQGRITNGFRDWCTKKGYKLGG